MLPKENNDVEIKKLRLGEYLVKKGLITGEDLVGALNEQKNTGQMLGQILVKKRLIDEQRLYQILAEKLGIEFIELTGVKIPSELISLISEHIARTYCVMPLKLESNILTIAMINPRDTFAIDELRTLTGLVIRPVMSMRSQIEAAIERYYGISVSEEILSAGRGGGGFEGSGEMAASTSLRDAEGIEIAAEEAPIITLVNNVIHDSVNKRASDIHIEPLKEGSRVRCRIDGILHEIKNIPKDDYRSVVSRIKIMANMDIAERRLPQDGSFRLEYKGKHVDVRVSSYPTMHGEKIVMRLLVREFIFLSLNELGFESQELTTFDILIKRPCGIILVVGPTGSGKTTTLYSALSQLNSREKNIVTVEDPIEYEIDGISQSQVNIKAGFTFANSLRSMMRQNPDIILVGEIRDMETAELAVRAALTGHLVFSTLHTNDAPGAVTRLLDMGVEPYLIASCLIGALAQRLVKRICPKCKEQIAAPAHILEKFKTEMESIKATENKFYRGKGCSFCMKSGFKGREGAFELLSISGDKMKDTITSGFQTSLLRKIAQEQGFRTMKENGLRKALRGETTLEEVLQVTELV
jgi:type IV pilus assembly protein PilB